MKRPPIVNLTNVRFDGFVLDSFPAGNPGESALEFVERLGRGYKRARGRLVVSMRAANYEIWDGPCGPRARIMGR